MRDSFWKTLLIGCLGIMTALICVSIIGVTYLVTTVETAEEPPTPFVAVVSPTPSSVDSGIASATQAIVPSPTMGATATTQQPTPAPTATESSEPPFVVPSAVRQDPVTLQEWRDLEALWSLNQPPYDYFAVAERYGQSVGERTVAGKLAQNGEVRTFVVDEREVMAQLIYTTDNFYFWAETALEYGAGEFDTIGAFVEDDIYPVLNALFGEPWNPGVDNDPRISILHLAEGNEFDEIGFFNSVNQFPRTLDDASNEQEIIFLNMEGLDLETQLYYATLAHELHHLIHWNLDANETVWLNEGLAQLTEIYLGYPTSETLDYLDQTDTQLNYWDYDEFAVYRHYAVSYLFVTYLWERFGDDAIRQIALSPQNGLSSVREVLAQVAPEVTLEDVLADWAIANLLDDTSLEKPYGYRSLTLGFPDKSERVRLLPFEKVKPVSQYGVHYIDLREEGTLTVSFAGDSSAEIVPYPPIGNGRVWFAPSGADIAATLTHAIDLTSVRNATLELTAWYELEPDFDFAYVAISEDNGRTWETLRPIDSYTPGIYGAALTGFSSDASDSIDGWVTESFSLNHFAEQQVLLRFEVLNDGAFSERGFALADVRIPEINWVSMPSDTGWEVDGFTTIGTFIPQQWSVQLVQGTSVTTLPLDDLNRGRWRIEVENSAEPTTLVVMPQTPYTTNAAYYWLQVTDEP